MRKPPAGQRKIHIDELKAILERAKAIGLSEEDLSVLKAAIDTLAILTRELEAKGISIERLRRMLFGARTASRVLGDAPGDAAGGAGAPSGTADAAPAAAPCAEPKPPRPGHGRNGAAAYTGAEKVKVSHPTLKHGDPCPHCEKGKVYALNPAVLVRKTACGATSAARWTRPPRPRAATRSTTRPRPP